MKPQKNDTGCWARLVPEEPAAAAGIGDRPRFGAVKKTSEVVRPRQPGGFPGSGPVLERLPEQWDWRNVNNHCWITPFQSQGFCGACVAFAATAAVESHIMIEQNNPTLNFNLSEASLFHTADRGCDENDPTYGWYVSDALKFLSEEGICFEENCPFEDRSQDTVFVKGAKRIYRISGYDFSRDKTEMKRWLVEEGPLITTFSIYDNFRVFWKSGAPGIYDRTGGRYLGAHAVLVVGYDDLTGSWICKNSHKTYRGNSGFFKIAYGTAGVDNGMYLIQDVYPVERREEYLYRPEKLCIVNAGSRGWSLWDGKKNLKFLDNQEDANNALRVAQRHNIYGLIGMRNQRPNRLEYIMEYWRGQSGLPGVNLTQMDCIRYDPAEAIAVDRDEKGWEIYCGSRFIQLADDMDDALAILRLVQRHRCVGFIGRVNKRPEPRDFIMTYWE